MPELPWIMTQTWNDLLFAHWRVDPGVLRARVPAVLPLDLFDGSAWIGIVPFHMTNVAPRLVPAVPGLSAFPELNVRTYVTLGGKPGVYFFSLDATNGLAVRAARLLFHLPYYTADMTVSVQGDVVSYSSRRGGASLSGSYRPRGQVFNAPSGSLEYFLTERYCLYATDRRGHPRRLEIHHPAWPLQAAAAEFAVNTMTAPLGIGLPDTAPLLHFAKRQDMVAFPMTRA
jgi:uncharacterized protein YqjF (DUF2071 family)